MNSKDLAEAFDGKSEEVEDAELDESEEPDTDGDASVSADADVFFDDSEDRETRLEALRRLVRKLK